MRLLIIILLWPLSAYTQDLTQGLSCSLGATHISVNDPVFTPLTYRGTGLAEEVKYFNHSDKRKHTLTISLTNATLRPALSEVSVNHMNSTGGFLHYRYQRSVRQTKWNMFLGGGFYTFFSVRNLNIGRNDEIAWDFFSSLNVVASANRTFKERHQVEFVLSYPVVAYVVGKMRIPKDFPEEAFLAFADKESAMPAGAFLRSGELLSIGHFTDVMTVISYGYRLSDRFSLQATYRFRYYRYPRALDVKYGASQYLGGLAYHFLK